MRCKFFVSDAEGGAAGAQLAKHARVRDLVLMTVYGPLQYPRLGLVEAVLFGTGRPLMLVPAHAGPFRDSDRRGCLGRLARGEPCLV